MRVLCASGRERRRHAIGGRGGVQVRARALLARRAALPRLHAHSAQTAIHGAGLRGAVSVGAGRRAASVADAASGRHGGIRVRARGVYRGLRMAADARSLAAAAGGRGCRVLVAAAAAQRAAAAGAAIRSAAVCDGVARLLPRRQRGSRRRALPPLGRGARVQPVRRARAAQTGDSDVYVLHGAARHRVQRTARGALPLPRRLSATPPRRTPRHPALVFRAHDTLPPVHTC